MSREFGDNGCEYFDEKIDHAAADCESASDELTRLWGKFLYAFAPVARSIAASEASDSDEANAILSCLAAMPELEQRFNDINRYLYTFKRIAEQAATDAIRKQSDKKPL